MIHTPGHTDGFKVIIDLTDGFSLTQCLSTPPLDAHRLAYFRSTPASAHLISTEG